jgi:chorismate mutase
MEISEIREKINKLDNEIIKLIAERLSLSKEVAEYKRKNNLPIRNLEREKEVLDKCNLKLRELGINDKEFTEKIVQAIIDKSASMQEEINGKNK